MNKNNLFHIFFLLLVFNIYSCAQTGQNELSVSDLTINIQNDSSLVILDVRTPEELEGPLGKLENVINIPVQELDQRLDEIEKYKGNNIALICRTGRRSAIATDLLVAKGFKAKNVLGGMTEYRKLEKVETEAN